MRTEKVCCEKKGGKCEMITRLYLICAMIAHIISGIFIVFWSSKILIKITCINKNMLIGRDILI